MYHNLTQSLIFSPTGFSSGPTDPTPVLRQATNRFLFFRFFRDSIVWFSRVLNELVNERTILTLGFYVRELNVFNSFSRTTRYPSYQRTVVLYKKVQKTVIGIHPRPQGAGISAEESINYR